MTLAASDPIEVLLRFAFLAVLYLFLLFAMLLVDRMSGGI